MNSILIVVVAIIGFLLSWYALSVERKVNLNKNHKAMCDINDKISCTKAFRSLYGKMFGVQNSMLGMLFYVVVFVFALFDQMTLVFYLSVLSLLVSIYFAYVLYTKVKSFCLICHGIYLVNILLLIFSYSYVF